MKFNLLFLLFLCSFVSFKLVAIDINHRDKIELTGKDVKIIVDSKSKYTFQNLDTSQFKYMPDNPLGFGFYIGNIWLKFDLNSKDTATRILEFKGPQIDRIILYQFEKGKYVKQDSIGDMYPFHTRKIKHRYLQFAINPNGKYIVEILGRGDPMNLKMSIMSTHGLEQRDYVRYLISGIYFSILFFIVLVNLFILLFFREKRNFYLLCYLLTVFVLQLKLVGYGSQFFWGNFTYFDMHISIWSANLANVFFILFFQNFLGLKNISKFMNRLLNIVMVVLLINTLLFQIDNHYILVLCHTGVNVITLITILILLIVSIMAYYHNFEAASYLIISKVSLLIALTVFVFHNFGYFNGSFFADISLEIGIAVQVIFLTLAVIASFRIYKSESLLYLKELFQRRLENNRKLSLKIEERKADIQRQKTQLEYTNNEVISSINYARRIQLAIFQSELQFLSNFSDGFVYYQPKEIVGGDFYWQTEVETTLLSGEKEKLNIICIGDTNDQGVPGAMLGVLYMRILQSAVIQPDVKCATDILNYLRTEIYSTFVTKDEREGYKISCTICVINKNRKTLDFAGANASIIYLSKGQLTQTFGDDYYFEGVDGKIYYKQKSLQLQPTDTLYLYSDGLHKQLNLEKEPMGLLDLLKQTESISMKSQKELLGDKMNLMIKKNNQIDDFTLIGVTC